jgi:hypothetical protein
MTSRDALYHLIDELPESTLSEAERYLAALRDGLVPLDADEDDEPLTAEEETMIAASRADLARGASLTQDELRARLAARRGSD